jgi:uncharacterized protein YjbI with pentapeptide repeats
MEKSEKVLSKLFNKMANFIRRYPRSILVGIILIPILGVLCARMLGLSFWADWTGFGETINSNGQLHSRTLWDWLELLIIPIVLGLGAWYLNHEEKKNEYELSNTRIRENVLQNYFNQMTEMILKDDLRKANVDSDLIRIARTNTLTTLRQLDASRKVQVIQFLIDTGLIYGKSRNFRLDRADLSGLVLPQARLHNVGLLKANLRNSTLDYSNLRSADLMLANMENAQLIGADLSEADLYRAILVGSHLQGCNFSGANLKNANFSNANLQDAILDWADIREADFSKAKITIEQINKAKLVNGLILPDGRKLEKLEDDPLPRESRLSIKILGEFIKQIEQEEHIFLSFSSNSVMTQEHKDYIINAHPFSLNLAQNMHTLYLALADNQQQELGLLTHTNIDVYSEVNYFDENKNDYIHTLLSLLHPFFSRRGSVSTIERIVF